MSAAIGTSHSQSNALEALMKKIAVGAIVAAFAVMAMSVASASALEGKCKVEGNANFKKGGIAHTLPFLVPETLEYEFTSETVEENELPEALKMGFPVHAVKGVECEEAVTGAKWKGEATVTPGKGKLACGVAAGALEVKAPAETKLGEVDLKLSKNGEPPWAKAYDLDLSIAAAGANVGLKVGKSPEIEGNDVFVPEAAGEANFAAPGSKAAKEKRATECVKGELVELPFYATLAGTLSEGS
jgi:hypothetical protein